MKIESSASKKAKAAAMMGFDQSSVFDAISPEKYATEDEYLDALVAEKLRRESPEYQAARRQLQAELQQRNEEATRDEQNKAYKEYRSNVKLYDVDVREIDEEAAEMARRDLAAGRITASELGKAVENYAEKLTEQRKDSKAASQLFNAMMRGSV